MSEFCHLAFVLYNYCNYFLQCFIEKKLDAEVQENDAHVMDEWGLPFKLHLEWAKSDGKKRGLQLGRCSWIGAEFET